MNHLRCLTFKRFTYGFTGFSTLHHSQSIIVGGRKGKDRTKEDMFLGGLFGTIYGMTWPISLPGTLGVFIFAMRKSGKTYGEILDAFS